MLKLANESMQQRPAANGTTQTVGTAHVRPVAAFSRRDLMMLGSATAINLGFAIRPRETAAAEATLQSYRPSKDKTPALRAGVITDPYSFDVPTTFKPVPISNTMTGNFCMPRCAEPWLEIVMEDSKLGAKLQLMAVPLNKLTPKKDQQISELGTPEKLLPSFGPYITGSYFDEDSVQNISQKEKGGIPYYEYELSQLDASVQHTLTVAASKGEVLYLLVLGSSEKAWSKAYPTLRQIADSFTA